MHDINELEFTVRRDDLSTVRWSPAHTRFSSVESLQDGAVLLRIQRFGLTTNNITYGRVGDAMHYWDFFPAEAGWGRIPVWGFAEVVASRASGIAEGTRVYGYLPISKYLLVQPGQVSEQAFFDDSPHRRALPGIYQRYLRVAPTDPHAQDLRCVLGPIFATGFLIDHWLESERQFGAEQIVFASASSKTALAAAFMLSQRKARDFRVVALTSQRNRGFCEQVGYYDRVVDYAALSELDPSTPTVLVDMAGDRVLLQRIHTHFDSALRHSCLVGFTHGTNATASTVLPGPTPAFFFAPAHVEAVQKALGPRVFMERIQHAQRAFEASAERWLSVVHVSGMAAIEASYRAVLEGRITPEHGFVVTE